MELDLAFSSDVLVAGSGIAGIMAAITAAEAGSSVVLVCKGKLFSGSSFYPGTWGLGLIGPETQSDEADLIHTIEQIGSNMTDSRLVRTLVEGIHPAIERVRKMGVKLRQAENSSQPEFIPCFDHKHRDWNGLEFDSVRDVFLQKIREQNVKILSGWEVLELVRAENRVCGAVISNGMQLQYLGCKALVLATGGYGSLFRNHLCTADVTGAGQALALEAGCRLINMEFMQIMPGYFSPAYQTVFNEKTFRFTELRQPDGSPLIFREHASVMNTRSTHGPFTSRLNSKVVDLAIYHSCQRNTEGVQAAYSSEMKQHPPEFVKTYFNWLQDAKGLTMDDPVQIGLFSHAANGGIWIKPDASTGVPGLYAAGEVTGGMHGADRIGGLSTANGLVFGGIAGRSASTACHGAPDAPTKYQFNASASEGCEKVFGELQNIMYDNAMVERNEEGLDRAFNRVTELRNGMVCCPCDDISRIAKTRRVRSQLRTAQCILGAARLRKESRGAHYRSDFPEENQLMAFPICVRSLDGKLKMQFIKE